MRATISRVCVPHGSRNSVRPERVTSQTFEIFLATPPGLEEMLLAEVVEAGFTNPRATGGGVTIDGTWGDVWRANMTLRGTSKVLARIGEFRAFHLAQLDKRARKFSWGDILTTGHSVKVEVSTNKKSKIYHAGAAVERIERAIAEEFGATIAEGLDDADLVVKARFDDNNVLLSVDTSGEGLHKRGHKQAMGKAPMRETMAALFLRACGYDGHEPVLDPMCGSGTFLIEAAEIARHMMAGRARGFAFERLATYDAGAVQAIRDAWKDRPSDQKFYGSDRNVNVIGSAGENAARAGVADMCTFAPTPVSGISRPDGPAGLVIVNPPYGARVGKKKDLFALYGAFGDKMRAEFKGWRVGMITTDTQLAESCKLPWRPTGAPVAHGGLKVKLFRTDPL